MTKEEKEIVASMIDELAKRCFTLGRDHRLAQIEENPDRESEVYFKFLETELKTKNKLLARIEELNKLKPK